MMFSAKEQNLMGKEPGKPAVEGWAGWLLNRLTSAIATGSRPRPSLELVQRITLAPRQSLALIEADGRRLLVATSPDGAPAFYSLDEAGRGNCQSRPCATRLSARVSW